LSPSETTEGVPADLGATFPDEPSCASYLFHLRWPGGFVCPGCGGTRYASLKSRAYTYECLVCRHQTSVTAGTVMHRSRLPLTKWFSAAHLVATHAGKISARGLQRRLGIAYRTAWLLTRKLQVMKGGEDYEPLQGRVEIAQAEMSVEGYNPVFHTINVYKICVAIALELPISQPVNAKLLATRQFNRIRLDLVRNSAAASIFPFIEDNVLQGTTLLTEDLGRFRGLLDYGYDLSEFGEALPQSQNVLSVLNPWLDKQVYVSHDAIGERLQAFVAEANWRFSLERVLSVLLHRQPTRYWDIIGRENPHKGKPTARHRPRRRKTATGMREDGSRPS